MFIYARLDAHNKVVGISQLSGEIENPDTINISELEDKPELGFIYDPETGEFTPPEPKPAPEPTEPQMTAEEMQAQTLINTEYLVALQEMNNI